MGLLPPCAFTHSASTSPSAGAMSSNTHKRLWQGPSKAPRSWRAALGLGRSLEMKCRGRPRDGPPSDYELISLGGRVPACPSLTGGHISTAASVSMGLEEDFKAAAEEAKTLPAAVTDSDKLELYGLYKQGTVGDNDTSAAPAAPCTHRAALTRERRIAERSAAGHAGLQGEGEMGRVDQSEGCAHP